MKILKVIVLVLLFILLIVGINSREHYQFGGESMIFLIYFGWFVLDFYKNKE